MVIKTIQENIFNTDAKHIAFPVNTGGISDSSFTVQVSCRCWDEIVNCGPQQLGTVVSKEVNGKTFHALVCHSLKDGWGEDQAKVIRECFDKIETINEPIATIAIGADILGIRSGADFRQIVCGMHDSKQQIVLYANYTLKAVLDCYRKENIGRLYT